MKSEWLETLAEYVSENKKHRFEKILSHRTRFLTVILEDIYQSHNLSACLRSCDCFGIQDVHIIENEHSFEVSPEIAVGSSQWLTLHRYQDRSHNTLDCLKQLKQSGYHIVATSPYPIAGKKLYALPHFHPTSPTAIAFGTEKDGISEVLREHADAFLSIPMVGFTESLNLSVSLAVCMQVLTERIRADLLPWQLSDAEKLQLNITWMELVVQKHWPALFDRLTSEFPSSEG